MAPSPGFPSPQLLSQAFSDSEDEIPLSGSKARSWKAPDPTRALLVFPIFFIYLEYVATDILPVVREDLVIGESLDDILPGPGSSNPKQPWDIHGTYSTTNINIYSLCGLLMMPSAFFKRLLRSSSRKVTTSTKASAIKRR